MPESQPNNSLSWGDALFLYIERPGQPLSIAGVSVFDGPIPLKACREFVESKLPLVPRYLQRVAFPPFNIGLPHWESDPNFDIRNHIRQVTLRNGTERKLKALASKILSTHLERQRPLWDITLVRGLAGNRTGLIARIHHCLADGLAGVGIMSVLMDPNPVSQPIARIKPVVSTPARRPDSGAQLLDSLVKSYSSALQGALTLHSEALKIAQQLLASPGGQANDLMSVVPEIATPAERLPFNIVCHGPQKFGWTEVPMADIKLIRERCGGTVNDVILTVMAAALRRYAELRNVHVKGRSARIMIPVSVRGEGRVEELGNRLSFLPVTVPLDIRDPQKLFAFVRQRTEHLKRIGAAEVVGFAGALFGAIPTPVWAAIGPVASQLPLSLCNIICTNVPGPPMPLYLLGRKMLSWYPYVPIGGEMGFNCAILSYNGTAYFGFTCDVGAIPDPAHLEKFVDASYAELLSSSEAMKLPAATPPESKAAEQVPAKRKQPARKIPLAGNPASRDKARPKARAVSAATRNVSKRNAPVVTETSPSEAVAQNSNPAPAPASDREPEALLQSVGA
jgi:diacylglycerol O-acyltransferase